MIARYDKLECEDLCNRPARCNIDRSECKELRSKELSCLRGELRSYGLTRRVRVQALRKYHYSFIDNLLIEASLEDVMRVAYGAAIREVREHRHLWWV